MNHRQFFVKVANLILSFENINDGVLVNENSGTRHFFCEMGHDGHQYQSEITIDKSPNFPKGMLIYSGLPWGNIEMPYHWTIADYDGHWGIEVCFEGRQDINQALAIIYENEKRIAFFIDSDMHPFDFDPFLYPLGILVFIYLTLFNGGLVVHASGVQDGEKGYLFSGLSGIGKSTMARLWEQRGALIINDDRLILMPGEDGYVMHNTPMPYYEDYPKNCSLNGVFLLKQAKENYCVPIFGATGMMRFMANCMQHFHTSELVKLHLSIVEAIVLRVPVYELGFKPDTDVVDLVRELNL